LSTQEVADPMTGKRR